jgi:hypothetical protein
MISPAERDFIGLHAYVPEHVVEYGSAVSGAEPHMCGSCLCYEKIGTVIIVGYPLPLERLYQEGALKETIEGAKARFKPERIALIAPSLPADLFSDGCVPQSIDQYYKLDVHGASIPSKVRNMIKRASRELTVERGQAFRDEHKRLISEFPATHSVDDDTRFIMERIPDYIQSSETVSIIDARDGSGRLIAFDVVESGYGDCLFYMFNVTSKNRQAPGVSDLLLYELVRMAQERGKTFINLGLGINRGVAFFKKKWGGKPFLDYAYYLYQLRRKSFLAALFQNL